MPDACILIADDEPKHVRLLREVLTAIGYQVLTASRGAEAVKTVAIEQPDLMILDIVLLGELDGYQVVQRIREFSSLPIIMLTAKSRESDMLLGYKCGIDDFITKPFSTKLLLARVRAILQRTQSRDVEATQTEITLNELHIDLLRRRVTLLDREIHLTPIEYKLLLELAKHPNRTLLHEQLLSSVWGVEKMDDLDYLRAYIHYLRRKLEPDPANPRLIIRVPGVGYMLSVKDEFL
ncbi:MAG: response regulator transcription factor [Chloroflexota bacterium]|nr:response regulator transcription factor [Chloroflexota bacterium]